MGTGQESSSPSTSRKRSRRVTQSAFKAPSGWKFLVISILLLMWSVLGLLAPGNADYVSQVIEIFLKGF